MKIKLTINTNFEINKLKDLEKYRNYVEVNNLEKPNFSRISRELGVDRRTAKKHYDDLIKKERKPKKSVLDEYYKEIAYLLSNENIQEFEYKTHLYRYLTREKGLKCSRSNFNHFILCHSELAKHFNKTKDRNAVKTETSFGYEAQFDWKEKLRFEFSDGSIFVFNVGSLVLSASRFKVWSIYPSTSQEYLFDFLTNAFQILKGVPKRILIDNATTMMINARTGISDGSINPKFKNFADDFQFDIKPCVRSRPQTKAKVESPNRVISEIMNYNGTLANAEQLYEKMNQITNEANLRKCESTLIPPVIAFKKEQEYLQELPNSKIISCYLINTKTAKVNINGLFKFKNKNYSVPSKYIGKTICYESVENKLYVYYKQKLITIHDISEKLINYSLEDHREMIGCTFNGMNNEQIEEYAKNHLKELEIFNEQISKIER